MVYRLLQPSTGKDDAFRRVSRITHHSKIPHRASTDTEHRPCIDELPLLEIRPISTTSSNKRDSVPYLANIAELDYDTESAFENDEGRIDKASYDRTTWFSSLRASFSTASRYIRSSGPAKPSLLLKNTTEVSLSRMPTGWRLGTWVCCSAIVLCIIVEAALLIYATKTSSGRGSGILMEGNCKDVRELELWLLLPLNIAGTMLIGTSNYVMQVVCAPERQDIDEAHAHARSIAVGGVRFNDMALRKGIRLRRCIWWILGASSVPVHFLLNVAVYSSVQASNTGVLVVSDDFDTDAGWDYCGRLPSNAASTETITCSLYQNYKSRQTVTMTTSQCLRQYSKGFQTNASSVIVVTGQQSQRWYTVPLTAEIPNSVSYGMHCSEDFATCLSDVYVGGELTYANYSCATGTYSETTNNLYNFTPNSPTGSTTISLDFFPFCHNHTGYTKHGQYLDSAIVLTDKSSPNLTLTSSDDLSLQQNDAISNITSVKALFSAFQYRYWAVANASGDYLNPSYADLLGNRDPRTWLCPRDDLKKNRQCDVTDLQRNSTWAITPNSMPVQNCHVLPKDELCTLRYSSSILIITICFDFIKLSAMVAAVTMIAQPLMTLGDVIHSFLRVPDQYTEGRGLLDDDTANFWTRETLLKIQNPGVKYVEDRFGDDIYIRAICKYCGDPVQTNLIVLGCDTGLNNFHRRCGNFPLGRQRVSEFGERASTWLREGGRWWTTVSTVADHLEPRVLRHRRWSHVPSASRWTWSVIFYLPALLLAILYFTINYQSLLAQRLLNPWIVGFDAPDPNSLLAGSLAGTTSIYGAAMLINAPQIAFSLLYFIFNSTLTMMHTAHEWASFAVHRKALRVSSPRGQQRSTYWLQLPWSYSIPLIVISGSMHWLLSRSLYIVKVEVYGYLGEREADKDYFACGYSPIPALLLVFVLTSMGVTLCGLASRWLPRGMPLVRLNSLAIASACHADPDENGLELEQLMWGQIETYSKNGKLHCSFSAKQVMPLREPPVLPKELMIPIDGWLFNPRSYRVRVMKSKHTDIDRW